MRYMNLLLTLTLANKIRVVTPVQLVPQLLESPLLRGICTS